MATVKQAFLYGCLGCLGIVVLVVLSGAIVSGIALRQVGQEQVERQVSIPEVPRAPVTAEQDPLEPPQRGGRVSLNLTRAEFEIEPLPPGERMRVEGTYDRRSYELTEQLGQGEGESWTYDVRFESSGSNLMAALRQLFGGTPPKVRVYLPVDVPIHLEVELSQGGGYLDLGGMWLTELDLQLTQGGFQIDVGEPLRQPVERISLRGSMGGMQVSRLGNASPRRLDVEFGMGGMELDLRGNWITDSEISIQSRAGGSIVRLPRDVIIQGLDSSAYRPPEQTERPLPTLRFSTTTAMGDLEIIP